MANCSPPARKGRTGFPSCLQASWSLVEFSGKETNLSAKPTLRYDPITRPRAENHRWFCMDFLKERYSKHCYLGNHNQTFVGICNGSIWKERIKIYLCARAEFPRARALLQEPERFCNPPPDGSGRGKGCEPLAASCTHQRQGKTPPSPQDSNAG